MPPSVPSTVRGSDYAELSRRVRAAGLMERRPVHYRVRAAVLLVALVGSWTAFVLLGTSWWQCLVAAALAVVWTQIGFLGHDAGHRQVCATKRGDERVGLVCANLLIGLGYGWWIDKHHRHHAHPNHEDHDPDISDGAIAFTPRQTRARTGVLGRALARHQAALFFPMLLLEGFALHVASAQALRTRPPGRARQVEIALFAVHVVSYVALVLAVLPPLPAVGFVLLHQGLFGLYMGCAFAPNHKGMPLLSAEDDLDFLRRQVLTSRNIDGGRATDALLGGLNHQIEHHLFPSMPSPALRAAKPIVRAFCAERGVSYAETTLGGSYGQVLRYLRETGRST